MLKRTWLLIAVVYLVGAEILSWLPVSDLSLCLIQPEHGQQTANYDNPKYCPAFHTGVVASIDTLDTFLERHDKSVIGGFTIVLAISTIGLWLATNKLWAAGEKQFGLLSESAAAQSRDMQASIAAAQEANTLNREVFIANQRAWLQWTIPQMGVLKKNGPRLTLTISGTLKNLGRIPASNISYFGRLYVPPPNTAAINLGQIYFSEHMAELQKSGFFALATVLPGETLPMAFGPEGVEIDGLPDSFSLYLAFHARYMFAVGAAPNPRAIAEIGSVYMIQAVGGTTSALKKSDVIAAETPVAIMEFPGARLLT